MNFTLSIIIQSINSEKRNLVGNSLSTNNKIERMVLSNVCSFHAQDVLSGASQPVEHKLPNYYKLKYFKTFETSHTDVVKY